MTSAAEQYREIVRHYLQQGRNLPDIQQLLERQRTYLNLLRPEAEAIERSVLETGLETSSQTNPQTYSPINSQADYQTNSPSASRSEPQTKEQERSPLNLQADTRTNSQADSETDSETGSQSHWQENSQINSEANFLLNSPNSETNRETDQKGDLRSLASSPNRPQASPQTEDFEPEIRIESPPELGGWGANAEPGTPPNHPAKIDSQPNSESDSERDSEPGLQSDSKLDSQPDSKLDSQPDSKLDSQPDSQSDSQPDQQPDEQPDEQPDRQSISTAEPVPAQTVRADQSNASSAEDLSAASPDPHPSETSEPESQAKSIASENALNPESLTRYYAAFAQAIRLQYPLDEVMKLGLRSLQQNLNLNDQTVNALQARAYDEFHAEKQRYELNLQQYREEFKGSRAFLYSESTQRELFDLQHKLGLRSEDVLRLEREVLREAKQDTQYDPASANINLFASADIQALEAAIQQEIFQTDDRGLNSNTVPLQGSASHPSPETRIPEIRDFHRADAQLAAESQNQSQDQSQNQLQNQPQNQPQNQSEPEAGLDTQNLPQSETKPSTQKTAALQPELEQALQELEKYLSPEQRDWWEADQLTFDILLKLAPDQSPNWLTMESIEKINQLPVLEQIDRLWSVASQGRFGLYAQQEVYKKVVKDLEDEHKGKMQGERLHELYIQEFVRRVGWSDNRLQFLKFYKWLDFQTDLTSRPDIPSGQFPAYWFWAIPRTYSLRLGGIGFGQGGWRIDVSRLRAWLFKIRNCKLEPYEKYAPPSPAKTNSKNQPKN